MASCLCSELSLGRVVCKFELTRVRVDQLPYFSGISLHHILRMLAFVVKERKWPQLSDVHRKMRCSD